VVPSKAPSGEARLAKISASPQTIISRPASFILSTSDGTFIWIIMIIRSDGPTRNTENLLEDPPQAEDPIGCSTWQTLQQMPSLIIADHRYPSGSKTSMLDYHSSTFVRTEMQKTPDLIIYIISPKMSRSEACWTCSLAASSSMLHIHPGTKKQTLCGAFRKNNQTTLDILSAAVNPRRD
jgi:hypothetical protein